MAHAQLSCVSHPASAGRPVEESLARRVIRVGHGPELREVVSDRLRQSFETVVALRVDAVSLSGITPEEHRLARRIELDSRFALAGRSMIDENFEGPIAAAVPRRIDSFAVADVDGALVNHREVRLSEHLLVVHGCDADDDEHDERDQ